MHENCIFCKIVKGDIPAKKVYESAEVLAFHDVSPQAPVHILIIPKTHYATLNDMEDCSNLTGCLTSAATRIAKTAGFDQAGYRTVINCNADGGQAVYHVHMHLLAGRKLSWPPG